MYSATCPDLENEKTTAVRETTKIFDEHGPLIRKIISFYAPKHLDIDEIYQDIFISLTEKPIPPHIKNKKGYLYRAIKNDVLDHIRRSKSYSELIRKHSDNTPRFSHEPNPYGAAWRSELAEILFAIAEKDIPHHEFIALKEQFHFSNTFAQSSANLNVNRRSFSRYLCMGIKNLKHALHERQLLINPDQ